jgi:hypothetical protein
LPLGSCLVPVQLQYHHGLFYHRFPGLETLDPFDLDPCLRVAELMAR